MGALLHGLRMYRNVTDNVIISEEWANLERLLQQQMP